MVEEIITALSRIRWLFVIARNSSFTYKGQVVDIKQVGRDLGVRYVLEGSVRKGGNRVRITAQLIEAATGAYLWADHFDGSLEHVFDLQDQIATSVGGVIEPALQVAEIRRSIARPTPNLTAYDAYLRALPFSRAWDKDPILRAVGLLDQAIEHDPDYGPALGLAAWCYAQLAASGWAEDRETASRTALDLATRAVRTASDDPTTLTNAAGALGTCHEDINAAIALIDQSLSLNPGSAVAWMWSGYLRLWAGQPDLSLEQFEQVSRLDPRTPFRPFLQTGTGAALFLKRDFDAAASLLATSLRQNTTYPMTSRMLAACYAQMGRLDQARDVVARMQATNMRVMPLVVPYRLPDHRELYLAGLRLAMGETE
jgi:tetratricopeptide (TPR) repeat protein